MATLWSKSAKASSGESKERSEKKKLYKDLFGEEAIERNSGSSQVKEKIKSPDKHKCQEKRKGEKEKGSKDTKAPHDKPKKNGSKSEDAKKNDEDISSILKASKPRISTLATGTHQVKV